MPQTEPNRIDLIAFYETTTCLLRNASSLTISQVFTLFFDDDVFKVLTRANASNYFSQCNIIMTLPKEVKRC
jgi:hypothetical protein